MDILKTKSDKELLQSVVAEVAKAQNEIACAQGDITKARNRLKFLLVVTNDLINRQGDKQK
jgi:hypothetical protein